MSKERSEDGWKTVLDAVCRDSKSPTDERLRALGSPGDRRAEDVVRVDSERHWSLLEDACRRAHAAESMKSEVLERCWRLDRERESHWETEKALRNEINTLKLLYEAVNAHVDRHSEEKVRALVDRVAKSENVLRQVRDRIRDWMEAGDFRDDVPGDVKDEMRKILDMARVLGVET